MKKDIVIISDFDGTISVKDVNTSIFEAFGNEKSKEVSRRYLNSEISLREDLKANYEIIGIDEKKFKEFVLNKMEIDNSFFELMEFAKQNKIEIIIVSGGFINYMELLFNKYGKKLDMPIYSNVLEVKNGIMMPKYGEVPECKKSYGPCGICKYKCIMDYKKHYTVIYAGDGYTDRCAAEAADVVFAKDRLKKYCDENGIKYYPLNTFKDIEDYIKMLK